MIASLWRFYVGVVAKEFNTPIPALLAMEWPDLLAWYEQAIEIRKITGGR